MKNFNKIYELFAKHKDNEDFKKILLVSLDVNRPAAFEQLQTLASQLELSYQFESMNRIALSLNHISNASLGEENPGVESMVISFIRVF